jgi:fatty acid desaturase
MSKALPPKRSGPVEAPIDREAVTEHIAAHRRHVRIEVATSRGSQFTAALGSVRARSGLRAAVEIPTLALIVATYAAWVGITLAYGHWPLAVVAPIGALLIVLHGSLQHEIVHRHPTRWESINRLFGMLPLAFWLPFERYRQTHIKHHTDARLTDPVDDPESYYWRPEDWARLGRKTRAFLEIQQTLAGRVVFGSFWRIWMFLHGEVHLLIRNEPGLRAIWLEHLMWCIPVVLWVQFVCGMPLWLYIVAIVIPGNGILLIRSFAEHRARPAVRERIAIVERSWLLGPLFLFNNLHSLHHEAPGVPWYEYNARYRLTRDRLIAENGGLVYCTYFEVARRYLFRPYERTQHPTGRV